MRMTAPTSCAALLILTFAAAQDLPKRSTTSTTSVRLPGTAIAAMQKIDPERIRQHVRFLSHDLLEGRGTG
jgi:hypothetical protein